MGPALEQTHRNPIILGFEDSTPHYVTPQIYALLCRGRNPAAHQADILAIAASGDGLDPGKPIAVAQLLHAMDGRHQGGIVT